MADQVLVRYFSFGDMGVGIRKHIVSPQNSSHRCHRVLPSENSAGDVDCCVHVLKDISRSVALNFCIWTRPPRSGLGVIKVK